MGTIARYRVLLLPQGEIVVQGCTLTEALAWMHGYHEIADHDRREAVLAEEGDRENRDKKTPFHAIF